MDEYEGWTGAELGGLRGWLAGQMLQTRTILMFGEVTPALAETVSQQLLVLAAQSPDAIRLVINAQGGLASDGEALFDLMRGIEPRVSVIGAGAVANAAALAFMAVPRAQRFCLPHARFSLRQHIGLAGIGASVTDAAVLAAQRQRLTARLAEQLGQPLEMVAAEMERADWLDAEEALAHGLVERIVRSPSALE